MATETLPTVDLVPITEEHRANAEQWAKDPEIVFLMGADDVDEMHSWFTETLFEPDSETAIHRALLDKDGELIGFVGLQFIRKGNHEAQPYIVIGEESRRDLGYATAAGIAGLRYAFEDLGFHRIGASFYAINLFTPHLLRRLGFIEEGRSREKFLIDGEWVDSIHYSILAKEYFEMQRS